MGIKALANDDRPREKTLSKGINQLSDSELLAIIMGSGNREQSAVELAQAMLRSCEQQWHKLEQLGLDGLQKFKGIGEAKAVAIMAALEICRRKNRQQLPEIPMIKSSSDAYQILRHDLEHQQVEEFWLMVLNQANKVLHKERLTRGGITSSVVDVRLIFKTALEKQGTGIIVAHNHPSGNLKPSPEDLAITKKIKLGGEILQIALLDHLIISANHYYSFADEGLLI
jgi:DNA repair protein RadC